MYATCFPRYLSEDWSGYHYIREAEYDGDGVLPVSAIVPKFYGYYVPESRVDTMLLSPILLFEDCGSPVDIARLKQRERSIIFSFWHRLHRLNIAHGSISSYSIMAQPGPLDRHPLQRSMSSPSFRLINFGDAVHRKQLQSITDWREICFEELEKVKDLVYGKFYLKSVPRKLPGYEVRAREYWTEHEDVYRYVERATADKCI
ncbi:hypothetical protein CPB85DRAFT_1220028 [Mucidula mucida]|nr:hypothetical protein CPB85DRAFT_1220028 [Mucidula mucida]